MESEEDNSNKYEEVDYYTVFLTNDDQVDPTYYIQAFTHFTYLFTNKQAMVCDLQGVYNSDMDPPTFELTDPEIYYRSKSGKNNVFGRTDPGEAGMGLLKQSKNRKMVNKGVEDEKEVGQYTVGPEATAVAVVAATLIIVQEVAVVLVKTELEGIKM